MLMFVWHLLCGYIYYASNGGLNAINIVSTKFKLAYFKNKRFGFNIWFVTTGRG